MRSFAFHLQKGGVGKSTLSVSVAYALSQRYRTILVDADPQGNSSMWLADGREIQHELADVLAGKIDPGSVIVSIRDRLDLLPTFGVGGDLKLYGENQLSREPFVFVDLLEALETLGYDVAVFDLSPGMSQLERSVLMAITEVIVPMMPDVFSLDGLATFADEAKRIEKGFKRPVRFRRLVVNGLNRSIRQHREIHERALRTTFEVFTVGQDPVFRKAQAEHLPAQEIQGPDRMKRETRAEIERLAKAIAGGTNAH